MQADCLSWETLLSLQSTRGAGKVSGYYTPFKTQTLTHGWLSGNRQRVLIGLEERSFLRDSTSLQGTRLADLICEGCTLIAGDYALLSFLFCKTLLLLLWLVLLHGTLVTVERNWITKCEVTHMNWTQTLFVILCKSFDLISLYIINLDEST